MFEIGFMELVLVAVIAIVVIGPQRLPETVRNIALWIGRVRRVASRLYQEVEKEVGMDDIRRQLHNEQIMDNLRNREADKNIAPGPAAEGEEKRDHRES